MPTAGADALPKMNTADERASAPTGARRLLVMDDDDGARRAVCRMLTRLGYDVEDAREGSEALTRFRLAKEEERPFAAVVLDLSVRDGLGGEDTLAALRALDPGVRAVASTGSAVEGDERLVALGFAAVLCKPYSIRDLSAAVSRVPDRSGHQMR
jgi:two-component system, cell cycle sensor histidine kinase and response regulator CckA